MNIRFVWMAALLRLTAFAQPPAPVEGIPEKDPLVIARCSGCHKQDERGNLTRISWIRTTPEGWQEAMKRMVRLNGVVLSPEEARAIVKTLSTSHGLAPEEERPAMYMAEHRMIDEKYPTPSMRATCASCHPLGRVLQWRRSREEWQLLVNMHIGYFPDSEGAAFRRFGPPMPGPNGPEPQPAEQAVEFLGKNYGLQTPEWSAWQARMHAPRLAGKWLLTAHSPGLGNLTGEMEIAQAGSADEFTTRVKLRPVQGGPVVERTGRVVVYTGYSWRGRSTGTPSGNTPGAIPAEMREVLWISPDAGQATGRWFWGAYDEFGFDVSLVRSTGSPLILSAEPRRLKSGSQTQRVRILGDSLPAKVLLTDLDLGPGVIARRVVSNSPTEVILDVDVTPDATPGKRDITLGRVVFSNATAVYDTVDLIKVIPETPVARLGGDGSPRPKGYQQFEVMAYNRGADNKVNTADDVELGPVPVTWSVEEFYESFDDNDKEFVGTLNLEGLFTPAIDGPNPGRKHSANNHGNVWVVATAQEDKDKNGKPLVAKSYLVVAPPLFIVWDRGMDQ